MIEEMIQSRPAKKKLYKMEDESMIEAVNYEEALKIHNQKHEKI